MYENKEQVLGKMREIASLMEQKVNKAEELKQSALMDRGRLEELKNLYDMFVAKEEELAEKEEKPAPKKKAPAKKRVKK
jgi:hypothetical protein